MGKKNYLSQQQVSILAYRSPQNHNLGARPGKPSAPAPVKSKPKESQPIDPNNANRFLRTLKPTTTGYTEESVGKASAHLGDTSSLTAEDLMPVVVSAIGGINEDVAELHRRVLAVEQDLDDSDDSDDDDTALGSSENALYPAVPTFKK